MTSKFTREELLNIINADHVQCGEASALARMALAAMDAEPVAYIFKHPAGRLFWALTDESNKGQSDVMPVYAAPQPAPVVPDEIKHRIGGLDWGWEGEFNRGWNACRAAMLNGGKS
ncbi:Uncharacterised protein [Klebsiella pneumoniae]|nr:Uncharacterised protein [Klebsiella pneumoniae]